MRLTIANDLLAVTVAPEYGARVTSLVDKTSGRDWMAPGGESPRTGEDAVYGADEAVGWDECFPTVAPWEADSTAWGRRLRDHGDLWGRPWRVDAQSEAAVTTSHATGEFRFSRSLELKGARLYARYRVSNLGGAPLPYLWALHGLLAVTAEDRIELGAGRVAATYLARGADTILAPELAWPGPDAPLGLALDRVHPAATRFAGKLYASNLPRPAASVGGRNGWLDIDWSEAPNHVGLWLNYGGWPAPGNVHHIAIEPTSAPVDHLGEAIARGGAPTLQPGQTHSWTVTLTCRPASQS